MKLGKQGQLYVVEGEQYPRVTSILGMLNKPALPAAAARVVAEAAVAGEDGEVMSPAEEVQWLKGAARRLWTAKANRGRDIHRSISEGLMGEPFDEGHDWAVWQAADVLRERVISDYRTEITLVSTVHKYAGTADIIAPGVVLDWKTGGLWEETQMQLWAYMNADHYVDDDNELVPLEEAGTGYAVKLDPHEVPTVKAIYRQEVGFATIGACFLGLVDAYRWNRDRKELWT